MTVPPRRGEFRLIAELFAPLAADYDLAFQLQDDAALLRPEPNQDIVVTTDCLVGGVHFLEDGDPTLIGRKALRVNLSDLAAMGARATGYVLAVALPPSVDDAWLDAFGAGLRTDRDEFVLPLIGGDVVATSGPLTLTVTAFGVVPTGRALRRNGARPGDSVYVSGSLGDAALGLKVLDGKLEGLGAQAAAYLTGRYWLPRPRLALGQRLIDVASAAIDVSDGLVADLGHICETSGVSATLDASRAPLSDAARAALERAPELDVAVLTGGDDYELVFTAAPTHEATIEALAAELGLTLTRIGETAAGAGVEVVDAAGKPVEFGTPGYSHF